MIIDASVRFYTCVHTQAQLCHDPIQSIVTVSARNSSCIAFRNQDSVECVTRRCTSSSFRKYSPVHHRVWHRRCVHGTRRCVQGTYVTGMTHDSRVAVQRSALVGLAVPQTQMRGTGSCSELFTAASTRAGGDGGCTPIVESKMEMEMELALSALASVLGRVVERASESAS